MRLLIRSRWQPGESWSGYLLRLAHCNGLPALAGIAAYAQMSHAEMVLGEPATVLKRLGVTHTGVPAITSVHSMHDHGRLSRLGRAARTPICPACLAQDAVPFLRARWEWPLEVACPEHRVQLVHECPRCGTQPSSRHGWFLVCCCGLPYRAWRAKPARFSSETIRQVLDLRLADDLNLTFQPASDRERKAFAALRNIASAAGLTSSATKDGLARLRHIGDRFEVIRHAAPWFEDWPNVFVRKLHQHGWAPGPAGSKYLSRHSLRTTDHPQLEQVWTLLRHERLLGRVQAASKAEQACRPDLITMKDAASRLDVKANQLSSWVRGGGIEVVDVADHGWFRRKYLLRSEVRSLQRLLKATLPFMEAARTLGITPRLVHVLLASGVIEARLLGRSTESARINPASVKKLEERIFEVAKHKISTENMLVLTKSLCSQYKTFGPSRVRAMVEMICTGRLPVYCHNASKKSWQHLYVTRADMRRFGRVMDDGLTVPS